MKEILKSINRIGGVRGSLVASPDGLVIDSELSGDYDANSLGAVASSVIISVSGAVQRLKEGQLTRFVINGSNGSMVLMNLDKGILLTLVRKDANMGMVLVELKQAATELSDKLGG